MFAVMRMIALVLVCLLSNVAATVAAQARDAAAPAASLSSTASGARATPLADAASRAAQAAPAKAERRGGLAARRWLGLGMFVGGAVMIVYGGTARDDCADYRQYDTCGDFRKKYYLAGGSLMGGGTFLLLTSVEPPRRHGPAIAMAPGRLVVKHRVVF
jgi:hypothetical protein